MALSFTNRLKYYKVVRAASATLMVVFIVFAWLHQHTRNVYADTVGSWSNIQTPKITWENSTNATALRNSGCVSKVGEEAYLYSQLVTMNTCTIKVGPLEIGSYVAGVNYTYFMESAVKFPGDSTFHNFNIGYKYPNTLAAVPNSERMIEYSSGAVWVYKDVPEHFTKIAYGSDGQNEYHFTTDVAYTLKRSDGSQLDIGVRRALSSNGKWLAVFDSGVGIIRVNLDTYEAKRLTDNLYADGNALIDVSDTGEVAFYNGTEIMTAFIYDGKDCGTNVISTDTNPNPCPYFDAGNYIASYNPGLGRQTFVDIDISNDGHKLSMQACNVTTLTTCKIYSLSNLVSSTVYGEEGHFKYLALGDSISSGEGDIAKNPATNSKYYRDSTDVEEDKDNNIPREKCHLSMRSYPYHLSLSMGLGNSVGPKQWDSVACSGAETTDIYQLDNSEYDGQEKGGTGPSKDGDTPRLEGFDNKSSLQSFALDKFVPGRERQIEFVKKYRPKVITLTAGANDIDFSKKLQTCILPNAVGLPFTCDWADSQKQSLAKQIQDSYDDLVTLYQQLYIASGKQAKVYVLGYPQVISDDNPGVCKGNIGSLNLQERQMIVNATSYLNEVIKHAANAAGAKYIDISHALDGHKLCEGDSADMNGIVDFLGWEDFSNLDLEMQESFHPNSAGQTHIALAVEQALDYEDMQAYDVCPETISDSTDTSCPKNGTAAERPPITDFNGVLSGAQIKSKNQKIMDNVAKKNSEHVIKLDKYNARPGSNINISIHSNPVDLGDYIVSSDGSFSQAVTIPSTLPAGYHTLILVGQTYSGEPIEITQTILVTGDNSDDLDDNGVLDAQQACGPFIAASGVDTDFDGIDDACDPEISNTPQLYRLRQGDDAREYNGLPEHSNYLYIERNIHASSVTGVIGDDDPDSDGWAIVGASQGSLYSSTSAPDTAPAANFKVIGTGVDARPYAYIRAGGWGCTSFTPSSLAKVEPGQTRNIKKVDYNTDQCRQEDPADDLDDNGRPDNTQPLYEAHQGDVFKSEDPSRIYLYRNFYSSEAQLGISDYTPTGTPASNPEQAIQVWNLLASSKPNEYIPAFNKLAILEDSSGKPMPIILTKKQNGQCIAYQPDNTQIIKMTTQSSRYLKKLTNIPEGVNCE